jgi:hypothetical protein
MSRSSWNFSDGPVGSDGETVTGSATPRDRGWLGGENGKHETAATTDIAAETAL